MQIIGKVNMLTSGESEVVDFGQVYTASRRVRVQLRDTYFASAIASRLAQGFEGQVRYPEP